MTVRTDKRVEFMTDVLTGAIENYGYGWFTVDEYRWEGMGADAYAVVTEEQYDGAVAGTHRIDLDLIAKGLGVIRAATYGPGGDSQGEPVLRNGAGERMYLARGRQREIMLADRTNGDEGDLDVVDYLAIVEIGLFGRVTYG